MTLVRDFAPGATATFSEDRAYRYMLTRDWGNEPVLLWIMLNPSTADALADDPTIRRCIAFSKAWGYGGLTVCNLFGLRSTDPKVLAAHPDPVGEWNDAAIRNALAQAADEVIVAWGAHPFAASRASEVSAYLVEEGAQLRCLGRTKGGRPRHPLYVASATKPLPITEPWDEPDGQRDGEPR